jgi:hypothetical protein
VLLRTATCIGDQVEVIVDCSPLFNYGTTGRTWSYRGQGSVSMTAAPEEGDLRLDLAGNIRLGVFGIRCYGRTTLTDGESAYVTLSWDAAPRSADLELDGDQPGPVLLDAASASLWYGRRHVMQEQSLGRTWRMSM